MKFYRLSSATFYDCINTMYQFIKPFLDNYWGHTRNYLQERKQVIYLLKYDLCCVIKMIPLLIKMIPLLI